ncbi:MAG: hypothetical protein J7498_10375 [Sphingobium sp.]|nr:hypothetical protein [Sphingobium sp.]
MASKFRALLAGAVLSLPFVLSSPEAAVAQNAKARPAAAKPAKAWTVPRTPWGDPDLRGQWPIDYLAGTPRERPASYGNRAQLSDDEYEAALAQAARGANLYEREEKAGKLGMGHWTERGKPLRQTSLTVEPANGRMPPATEEGKKRSETMKSSWTEKYWEWVDDFNTFDRCITRGMPSSMLPGAYNMGIAIYQSPGYVAIQLEMIHETRIIPLDGRAAPAKPVKNWLGYSRGHWEGNTLVIETTNFHPGAPLGNSAGPRPVPNSDQMTMTERLTPIDHDTIRYEAWIRDPVTLTAPFKLDFPWRRNDKYVIYEYACHEGNIQMRGFIEGTSPKLAANRKHAWAAQGVTDLKEGGTEEFPQIGVTR